MIKRLGLIKRIQTAQTPVRMGWAGYVVLYLVFAAVLARTLAVEGLRPQLPTFLAGELLYLLLLSLVFWLPNLPDWLLHLDFTFQSLLVLWLISRYPEFDFQLYFSRSVKIAAISHSFPSVNA